MDSLLAYIVQVNTLMAIIYGGYILLLKNLTFYQLNRVYFLLGAAIAFVYPFFDIKSLFQRHIEPVGELVGFIPDFYVREDRSVYTLENMVYASIAMGIVFLGVKFCIQLLSLFRVHLHSVDATWKRYIYRNVLFPVVPFSFLNKIYLNKEQHKELELEDIFEHEAIHVKGLHSMDILLFEIVLIGCWYNPFVWLMRTAIRQNLEFLTDQQVLKKGVDRQTYQYSLLNVSKQGVAIGISNQFNFKLLKKRIMMMNKKRSSKLELSKYAFLLPIIIFSAGAFTVTKADDHIIEVVNIAKETDMADLRQVLHIKEPILADTTDLLDEKKPDTLKNVEFRVEKKADELETDGKVLGLSDLSEANASAKKTFIFRSSGGLEKSPLVIVDGVKQIWGYDLHALKRNDIASVEILRDRAAITDFGDAGRNGVIKVTTKGSQTAELINIRGDKVDTSKNQGIVVKGYVKDRTTDVHNLTLKAVNSNGKQPLVIVDGVEKSDQNLTDISPDDIESISVLKDAAGTAIYGGKGADGVMLMTTKVKSSNDRKTNAEYTDDDVFFINGLAVSKNEFKAVPRVEVETVEVIKDTEKTGRRFEMKTK